MVAAWMQDATTLGIRSVVSAPSYWRRTSAGLSLADGIFSGRRAGVHAATKSPVTA
jgi:hypothetical protein